MQKRTIHIRLLLAVAIVALSFVGFGKAATAQGTKIVVAAVKGVESAGIKAVMADWEKKTGNSVELIELPYPDLQDKGHFCISPEKVQFKNYSASYCRIVRCARDCTSACISIDSGSVMNV